MVNKENIPEPEQNLKFIDVHCHLPFPRPRKNDILPPDDIQFQDYFSKGGLYLITSTIDMNTIKITLKFMNTHNVNFGFTCGWAPQTVTFTERSIYKKQWKNWVNFIENNQEKYLAIGEIGLDFHHAKTLEERNRQIEELYKIFDLTNNFGKPYVIHIRNPSKNDIDKTHPNHKFNRDNSATEEILELLDNFKMDPKKVMFHCFSGPKEYGTILPKKGFTLSVPSSAYGFSRWRNVTRDTPIEFLVTETDSYYQHPYKRGPINTPTNVKYSIAAIAYSHNLSQKEVSQKTTVNAKKFFNI
ncbi:MAG: TatD family hydrolase [Candidatus Lokiarchaeota archaeon]|nr:TatD family hydrolase [Candidatus Lokiarchaeota archaeon]